MGTFINSEVQLCGISSGTALFVNVKKKYLKKINRLTPLNMGNGLSQSYLSNQKKEAISIQRVNYGIRLRSNADTVLVFHKMGRDARKPVFGASEKARLKPVSSAAPTEKKVE